MAISVPRPSTVAVEPAPCAEAQEAYATIDRLNGLLDKRDRHVSELKAAMVARETMVTRSLVLMDDMQRTLADVSAALENADARVRALESYIADLALGVDRSS